MPVQRAVHASPLVLKYADIDDDDGVITSFATSASEDVRSGAEFNGALGTLTLGGTQVAYTRMHQLVAISSSNAGSYVVGSTLTAVGTDQKGQPRMLTATVGDTDGGETLNFVDEDGNAVGMLTITSITVDAQNDTSGAWTIGVRDVVFDEPARVIRAGSADNIAMEFEGGYQETLPFAEGETYIAYAKKILDSGTAAFPVVAML